VISDWRLYSDETHTFWQPLQGYEVLDYAAQKGNRALFALTSQADFIVHQIRNLQGIRFQIIKKENLSDQQWYILTDLINDACEAAFAGRASLLDDSAVWRQQWTNSDDEPQPSLKQQYISLWNTVDHKIQLQIISELADECWQYLETNPRPYVLGAFPQLTISKKRFVLQDVMVLRRLWYGLWYKYKPPGKFSTERQKELVKKVYMLIFGEPGIGSITQKTNNLCLKIASMDDRLFPEEISWLMGKNLPDNRG
jgi:hypothetical protein